jgi:hypothetical protein
MVKHLDQVACQVLAVTDLLYYGKNTNMLKSFHQMKPVNMNQAR